MREASSFVAQNDSISLVANFKNHAGVNYAMKLIKTLVERFNEVSTDWMQEYVQGD